jgi:peptide chain release factor 2
MTCYSALMRFGGIFDVAVKKRRLLEVDRELEAPGVWDDTDKAQALSKERVALGEVITMIEQLASNLFDAHELVDLIVEEQDVVAFQSVEEDVAGFKLKVEELEFRRMFNGAQDASCAFLDIQSGSGGTEAQDWAEMLLRMYLRWGESHGFKTTLTEVTPGDVAGIKGATVYFEGPYAFGWLRTETGVHRLVRKSPFDSGNRRHTSFASVFISPEVDDDIEIDLKSSDLRVDTYRASGAGGQHVNKTDSAVRLTHIPTGVVVQCQSGRSQHQNRDQAMKQLKAKLYELEMQKKMSEQQSLEDTKADISWGSQIRSYVLDDSRIKDLRTHVETRNTQAVLDGGIDLFLKASLKQGAG